MNTNLESLDIKLEKIEIATSLVHTCTIEQLRSIKKDFILINKEIEKWTKEGKK